MKILMVVHQFLPRHQSGAELYTYYLSKELSKRHQVHLFYGEVDYKKREYSVQRGEYKGIPFTKVINTNMEFIETYQNLHIDKIFTNLLEEFHPDIIHLQHLLNLSVNIISIAKAKGIPVLMTLHEYWLMCPRLGQLLKEDLTICNKIISSDCVKCIENMFIISRSNSVVKLINTLRKTRGVRKLTRIILPQIWFRGNLDTCIKAVEDRTQYIRNILFNVDMFIAPSLFLRDKFIKFGIPEDKIVYSDNGMNMAYYKNIRRKESDRIRFAFIGSQVAHKGVHVLVKAFNGVADNKAELNIYGDMTMSSKYSRGLAKAAKNHNIYFKGRFENEQIGEILSNTDVLVVPSIWFENSPLTIHEAFIAGIPVITSNLGGMADLVQHGVNGLLFEVGNADDLRDKVNAIINDRRLLEKLRKGIPHVKTIEEDARDMEERYERLKTSVKSA